MQVIHACGCRGLGDIISGTSNIIKTINQDSHIVFHFPPGFDYKTTVDTLMSEFTIPSGHTVTHELDESWFTIRKNVAVKRFQQEGLIPNKDWFFFASGGTTYVPLKTQWKGDVSGPICLSPNNENTNPYYPYPQKWFMPKLNDILMDLVDEKKYLYLGRPYSIKECIDKMSRCRYVVGVDGAWTHLANAMRVPYILVRNKLSKKLIDNMHKHHPSFKCIETYEIFSYLR